MALVARPYPSDFGKRVRAARGYAGLSKPALGAKLEISKNTLWRTEAGKRYPKDSELRALARICKVPIWFFFADFDQLEGISPPDAGERFQQELEEGVEPSRQQGHGNESDDRAHGEEGPLPQGP